MARKQKNSNDFLMDNLGTLVLGKRQAGGAMPKREAIALTLKASKIMLNNSRMRTSFCETKQGFETVLDNIISKDEILYCKVCSARNPIENKECRICLQSIFTNNVQDISIHYLSVSNINPCYLPFKLALKNRSDLKIENIVEVNKPLNKFLDNGIWIEQTHNDLRELELNNQKDFINDNTCDCFKPLVRERKIEARLRNYSNQAEIRNQEKLNKIEYVRLSDLPKQIDSELSSAYSELQTIVGALKSHREGIIRLSKSSQKLNEKRKRELLLIYPNFANLSAMPTLAESIKALLSKIQTIADGVPKQVKTKRISKVFKVGCSLLKPALVIVNVQYFSMYAEKFSSDKTSFKNYISPKEVSFKIRLTGGKKVK